ncbi:phosphoglycerate kinase [Mycoplasma sp. ATU-Cv-703]|uniref:phosphoglycerate kinase n=1 Tax=Mycoplasma sp. ATU-Cv-703 TaxID=2498595 RepID=UPI000FDCDEB2
MAKKTLDDINLKNQTVLMRVDFNVPIENGQIMSDKRITAALPSIEKVISSGGKLVLFSHLGRVKTEKDKERYSLKVVAEDLSKKLSKEVIFINKTHGPKLEKAIDNLKPGQVLMVENTRFEDLNNRAESSNSPVLGKYWASLGDVFVNDAFGTAHRSHASNVGIAQNIAVSAVGYLVEKELKMLGQGLDYPEHPFVAIVGGAKVSDKIKAVENLLQKADKVIITGGMASTFNKALGHKIGDSLVENDYVDLARRLLNKYKDKIVLSIDFAIAPKFTNAPRKETEGVDIPDHWMSLDIGHKSIALFQKTLHGAKTVVWNGPAGVTEFSNYEQGTIALAHAIAKQPGVFAIIGGGDSAAAAIKLGFESKFSHISTGGGASLAYMEGKPLPAIDVIQNA